MPTALLIASNEVTHNPRLLKAADYLLARGLEVLVFDVRTGLAAPGLHRECLASRPWHVADFDISKETPASRARWLYASLRARASARLWAHLDWDRAFPFAMNRGLAGFPWSDRHVDIIIVNLVDNLPFAAALKERHGAALVYDSQELFAGEAGTRASPARARWVHEAERRCIGHADVVTTTTRVMGEILRRRFNLSRPVLRVRNAPYAPPDPALWSRRSRQPDALRLVWHGFAVNYVGRGVDLLLDAVAQCSAPLTLTLQGRIDEAQRRLIGSACERLGLAGRVRLAPAAHPERIVESLVDHDVALLGETGADENQQVTSSNKLFESLHAGLAVVAPRLPGLVETIGDDELGLLYPPGDADGLAACIDRLAANPGLLDTMQRRARAAAADITWQEDYRAVWERLSTRDVLVAPHEWTRRVAAS